jgi:hypothetical protein
MMSSAIVDAPSSRMRAISVPMRSRRHGHWPIRGQAAFVHVHDHDLPAGGRVRAVRMSVSVRPVFEVRQEQRTVEREDEADDERRRETAQEHPARGGRNLI